jgi:hypothetical protein
MTPDELDALWRDQRNHRYGVYFCKEDPRVIVPKRIKWMGWTINFARPSAIPVLILLFAILLVPAQIARHYGATSAGVAFTLIASIIVMCLFCIFLASPRRFSR